MNIVVLGTASGVGKTTVCAMFCRYLRNNGKDVAPFKGFNFSSESAKTADGGEIGTGQVFQAAACGLQPSKHMNPVLSIYDRSGGTVLKVLGKDTSDMSTEERIGIVSSSYRKLSHEHDAVICEGSGSPAEINLIDTDLANAGLMRATGVSAVIVADIERGGAFASLYGTWKLLPDDVRGQAKWFVINRCRGDRKVLIPAIEKIEEMTGMKCLGTLRFEKLSFPEEDSLSIGNAGVPAEIFLKNLDTMIEHAKADGFDFGFLDCLCEDT